MEPLSKYSSEDRFGGGFAQGFAEPLWVVFVEVWNVTVDVMDYSRFTDDSLRMKETLKP